MIKIRRGWVRHVNGHSVQKRNAGLGTTTYDPKPTGIIFHYTAGCGGDISGTLKARGISVTFSVDRDGTIYQYIPIAKAGWHAYGASHHYVGIEHTALPGECELTDPQLEASAALAAGIVEWVKRTFDYDIPLRKLKAPVRCDYPPGFCDHRDGDPCWNQNGHTDHLYSWSWKKYLNHIEAVLEPAVAYRVGGKTYHQLKRAIGVLKEKLRGSQPGDSHGIDVVKR